MNRVCINELHCDFNTDQFTKPIDLDKEISCILDIKIQHRCRVVENYLCLVKKPTCEGMFLKLDHGLLHSKEFIETFEIK